MNRILNIKGQHINSRHPFIHYLSFLHNKPVYGDLNVLEGLIDRRKMYLYLDDYAARMIKKLHKAKND